MNLLDDSPRESPKNSPESSSSVEGGMPIAYSQTTTDSVDGVSSYHGIQQPGSEMATDDSMLKLEKEWEANQYLFPQPPPTYMPPPPLP